jgi:hypothetical protein
MRATRYMHRLHNNGIVGLATRHKNQHSHYVLSLEVVCYRLAVAITKIDASLG